MEKLRVFINNMDTRQQFHFAERCGTTIGYLRRCLGKGTIGFEIAAAVDRESFGEVPFESMRPDLDRDIAYLTNRRRRRAA